MLWMPTLIVSEGYQQLLREVGHASQHTPIIFFNCKKTRTLLTKQDNCNKTKIKKIKVLVDSRQKRVDFRDDEVITLYKKYENPKTLVRH